MSVWPSHKKHVPPEPRPASLRDLRRWHRSLSRAHAQACAVSDEADEVLGAESEAAILISDPLIELHVALNVLEGMIEARTTKRPTQPKGAGQ